jgi:hypothetical protein
VTFTPGCAPDKTLFPDYDEYLEKSMVAETTGFFREMLSRDASLREFPPSDNCMTSQELRAARLATPFRPFTVRMANGRSLDRLPQSSSLACERLPGPPGCPAPTFRPFRYHRLLTAAPWCCVALCHPPDCVRCPTHFDIPGIPTVTAVW